MQTTRLSFEMGVVLGGVSRGGAEPAWVASHASLGTIHGFKGARELLDGSPVARRAGGDA